MLNWFRASVVVLAGCSFIAVAAPATSEKSVFDPQALFAPLSLSYPATAVRDSAGKPGPLFWQNRVDYKLHATIDTEKNIMHGKEVITYTNNSPDALSSLWVQLDQNIYRKDSRATVTSQWHRPNFTAGYQFSKVSIIVNGKRYDAKFLVDGTRMRVDLAKPLASRGGKLQMAINYHYQVPGTWGGRTAVTPTKEGKIFEIAQWFPRMAVYDDLHGWNTNPYLGSEFYLEYGDIDYTVTVPWNYWVVGSGKLINPQTVLTKTEQQRMAKAANSDKTVYIRTLDEVGKTSSRPTHSGTQSWHFHMQHTRDVAFAASPAFIIDAARINLPHGKKALAMSAYPPEGVGRTKWDRSTEYVKANIEHFSQWFTYPWPVAVNLGGHGAGMEYPGIVFDGMNDHDDMLFWITAHELGHDWFPMIVGSDERRHAFMDEGFNTFIDVYASDAFNHGEFGPKRDGEYAPKGGNPVDEILPVLADPDAPTIMMPADAIAEKYRHPISYFKPALGLILLREQILGPKRFDPAFKRYIATWAYKHPSPSDFFRFMESAAGEDLSWWWRGWYMHNWQLDMGITAVKAAEGKQGKGTAVSLISMQKLVMPATLRLIFVDGSRQDFRIPVETWMHRVAPTIVLPVTKAVKSAILDPEHKLPDRDRSNNQLSL